MDAAPGAGRVVGRYVLYDEIASGGMATVHLGRMLGQVGFARVVAVKRLHPHLARDPEFVAMFLDEARLAAGVRHPNVVATLDVVATTGELFLVMEYVEGDSLSHLIRATRRAETYIPPAIVSSIACGMLYGLHAAHVASDDRGGQLDIIHRDVSPQNILIGTDGVTRVADFGVAKASRRLMETEHGRMKGKFSYMAPEQVRRDAIDHRADVFCAGICTWEALTGRHLFTAEEPGRVIVKLLEMPIEPPSRFVANVSPEVDAIVMRALDRDRDKRFQSAREMAIALEDALPPAIARKVGEWVEAHVGTTLKQRHRRLAEMQADSTGDDLAQIAREISSLSVAPPPVSEPSQSSQPSSAPDATEVSPPPGPALTDDAPEPDPPAPQASEPQPLPYVATDTGTPISQMSGVLSASYTDPPHPPRRSKLPLPLVAAAAGAVIVVMAVILIAISSSRSAVVPTATAGASRSPSRAPAVAPPPAEPTPAAPEAKVVTPEPEPIAPAPAPPPAKKTPAPIAIQPEPKPATAPKATATAAVKPANTGCNPPYTVENGIKKFKRHCL